MSVQFSQSRGRFAWFRGLAKLCRLFGSGAEGRNRLAIKSLDDKLKRDIGIGDHTGIGVSDVRQAFYRKMLERGQPLP